MTGSLTLHWNERLSSEDVHQIMCWLEEFDEGSIDEDELENELISTELTPTEVADIIETAFDERMCDG